MRLGLTAAIWWAVASAALAQQPGDILQVRRETPVSVDERVIGKLPPGSSVRVERVEDQRLWCWTPLGAGWLTAKDLMTCQEALEYWQKKIDEGNDKAYFYLAAAQEDLGNLEEAIDLLDQFLRKYPNSSSALHCRGLCWVKLGHPDKAERDYTAALRLHPAAMTYNNRAVAWMDMANGRAGLQDCVKALLLQPENTYALVNRGSAQRLLGKYDAAVADYERALAVDDASRAAYRNYALLRGAADDEKFRDGKQAIELAQKACEATSYRDALSLSALAVGYAETGDWEAAIKWQTAAIEHEKLAKNADEHQRRLELFKNHQPYRLRVGVPVPID